MSHYEEDGKREYKLFIGGLHLDTKTDGLRDFYSQWGEIVDAVVMRDPNTKRSRGFGFVTYADEESMQRCMDNRPHNIDGREVEAKYAVPKEESTPPSHNQQNAFRTKKIFLGGLHLDTTDEDIREVLCRFGIVNEVVVKTDPDTNKPRGFGFAIMDDFDSVDRLCQERYVRIRDRDVEVKKAQSAEIMRRKEFGGHGGSQRPSRDRGGGGGGGSGGGMYDHQMGGRMGYGREPYGGPPYRGYAAAPSFGYQPYSEYYRDPYAVMAPGYPYGDRASMYTGYRNAFDASSAASASAYSSMYGGASYGSAASGYGPMRGYSGGSGSGGGGDQNGAYGGRNAGGRVYHPYKR